MSGSRTGDGLFIILDRFLTSISNVRNLEEGWSDCMSGFFASIDDVVGKHLMVKSNRSTDTASVPTSFLDELDSLRETVEYLNEEKTKLEERLNDRTALNNTLRQLPASKTNSKETLHETGQTGVIQRLVQKEKEVLRLQAEVAALSASKGKLEDAEAAKRERAEKNRQWANLMDEIAKNKAQIAEQQVQLEAKEKETKYLKRALESVYTRFQTTMEETASATPSHARDWTVAQVDAEVMASRSIATLAQRDEEVKQLKAAIVALQAALPHPQQSISSCSQDALQRSNSKIEQSTTPPQPELLPPVHPSAPLPPPAPVPPPMPLRKPTFDAQSMAELAAKMRISRPAPKAPRAAGPGESTTSLTAALVRVPPPPPPPPAPPFVLAPARPLGTSAADSPSPAQRATSSPLHPPPPAAAGGPPPPPPVPPLRMASTPAPTIRLQRKATQTAPAKKLKPFFWQKIAYQSASNTIWSAIDAIDIDLDNDELEQTFAAETKQTSNAAATAPKAKVASLLPISRAQNIAIMLARMRMSHAAIRDAVLQIDDKKMTTDRLKALKPYVPSSDEIKAINGYQGDFAALTASDQYFQTVCHRLVMQDSTDELADHDHPTLGRPSVLHDHSSAFRHGPGGVATRASHSSQRYR